VEKKNKTEITPFPIAFDFISFFKPFFLGFSIAFLILLPFTSLLSTGKVVIIRWIISLLFRNNPPYIHQIPFYRSISISGPTFFGLCFAHSKTKPMSSFFSKKNLIPFSLAVVLLWILELFGNLLEIIVTKMKISSFLPNFTLAFFLSVGSISFPLLLWFLLFFRLPRATGT